MALAQDKFSQNAMGGTELLKYELVRRMNEIDPTLLDNFQIFVSRVHEPINKDKIVLYWLHDLAEDPAAGEELKSGRWKRFDLLIFVSNWQMQQYIQRYNIPWSKCIVIENAINPIDVGEKDFSGKIKLVYTPTPHRGLEILIPAFERLQKDFPNKLQLDVFSSFKLYGWEERDTIYEPLFEKCRNNPDIVYHGSQSNEVVREHLKHAHIFAYPSIWPETSCLCLIEAMSARLSCVHPNYGALHDTSGGITSSYQWQEDVNNHLQSFYERLLQTVSFYIDPQLLPQGHETINNITRFIKLYADSRFSWDVRSTLWYSVLSTMVTQKQLITQSREQSADSDYFSFRTS